MCENKILLINQRQCQQTDRQTDGWAHRQTDRHTHTDRHTDRWMGRHTDMKSRP